MKTHLSKAINSLIEERDLVASDVAKKAGIDKSYFSLLRSGKQGGISGPLLRKLALALSRNPTKRAELITAHMKDESFGYYPGRVNVEVKERQLNNTSKLDHDIEYLQKHLSDSRIRQAVKIIVALHRHAK